ncbi:hypothetical protein ETAA8_07170 [Anatilimnocola aggregata]|uniref:Uncharacterized protein n=1 Tax=Anatilimnocola aggregata TaxID=2528021 RepID=A0A517Y5X5_9BACT|nr:hypothetical protein ETAA8_07170 [Anatilimnocola aggregata]
MQQLRNRKFPLFSLAREIAFIAQLLIRQAVTPSSFAITPYDTMETSKFNFHNFHNQMPRLTRHFTHNFHRTFSLFPPKLPKF